MPISIDKCIVCDSTSYSTDVKASFYLNLPSPYSVSKCDKCKFRWLNPQPTEKEYEKVYKAAYFAASSVKDNPKNSSPLPSANEDYSETVLNRESWYWSRLKRVRPFLPSARSILDIGAGTGEFLAVAREMDWEISGIEVSKFACDKASEKYGIELQNTSLKKFVSDGATFDIVHLSHVFEHFTDPLAALDKIKDLVGESGILIIEVPNQFRSWTEKVSDLKQGLKRMPRSLHSIHHPFFYSPKHLRLLLEKSGFEIVSTRTFFPERWSGGLSRKVLMLVDLLASLFGRGRNIEIIARSW